MYRRTLLVITLLAACKRNDGDPPAPSGPPPAACAGAKVHGPLAWIEDDYPSALACAKAMKVPLVIDLWASWCHTCISMKTTVFTDPSFARQARRFVFAAIDTEREANAPVVAKYPLSAWPTFYVVGNDEAVLARFVGAGSVEQMHGLLDAGAQAQEGVDGASRHLLVAERAIAAGDLETADDELTQAIERAPAGWGRMANALASLVSVRRKRGDADGCLALAERHLDAAGTAASATDLVGLALDCASDVEATEGPRAQAFRERAVTRLRGLLEHPASQLSTDDRSDAMIYLRSALDGVGKKAEAVAVAEKQRALLDDAIARAPTPQVAMTFNWHLAEVHVYLGRPLDAVPALERSAAALPGEYDPPARLGWVHLKAGKLDEAARWTDKALAIAYGPRKGTLLTQRADIAAAAGDIVAERAHRFQAIMLYESLPAGQANPTALARARAALAKIDEPGAAP